MLDRGDLDLNSVQSSRDLFKETMLDQELVFRRQVFELHELYRKQTAIMENLKQKGLDNYNLRKGGLTPVPVNQNNQLKCSMKPLDLQLSADEFISQCDNSSRQEEISKNYSQNKEVFDSDHLNLSLSIGQDASKKGREQYWKGKKTCSSSIDIIDLEDENLSFSNCEAYLGLTSGSAALEFGSRDKHKLDKFLKIGPHKLERFSQSAIRGGSYRTTLHRSPLDAGPSCQTQSLCDSGSNGHHKKFLPANLLDKNQRLPTCKIINRGLDLNTVQLEDQSYFSNNHSGVVNSSITSPSPVLEKIYPTSNVASSVSPNSWRGANNVSSFMVTHGIHLQKDVNFEDNSGEKCSKDDKFREGNETNISVVDLDSDSIEELCSSGSDPKLSSVGSSSKISDGLSREIDMVDAVGAELNLEKGIEEPFEQLNCCKLSSSSESEGVIDHSSSIKTMQSGVQYDDVNFTTSDEEEKNKNDLLVTQSGEQDLRSSDSSESNIQFIIREEPEVDGTIQIAAELLVQISSETGGAFSPGKSTKIPLKVFENEEDERPQCSSESYEAMVLKTEECSPDDYCVSSNAYMVDVSEEKDIRYKLKRGTRMKDFQKDIFPGISTLSRQEIREDINILEGVIRSREYKKMRAKMGDVGTDWCRSTRSKRSRVTRRF
ncbi:uncharacterized protein [Spinacia oleracea]|uniref:Uncharacterized protein isoform X2 n=1 Tax=Spinacia oleracea TaxID=3562 RepID=A0ABM3QUB2_SPIOL|nr:uncharacterized protein LOC110795244 isoform X2 [Spinacia oleracea]